MLRCNGQCTHYQGRLSLYTTFISLTHPKTFAYDRKVRGAGELCRREGIAFIPVVAESLGGLHPTAVEQLRRLARGVSMKTGEEEGTALNHLLSRVSLTLMKGLSSMVLNRI